MSIFDLKIDKYGNMWVYSPDKENGSIVYIFNEFGEFTHEFDYSEILKEYDCIDCLYPKGDFLLGFNRYTNNVTLFEYEIID
ncbi:MAG: hypothetical protein JXR48_04980 [Candidatus Delongbacteria bacterium]|nr:hypothetical protein [Candidatus Delongbacteria bacterium]MBN2834302.1 hypothetical protein [Candidatus Delongbacteria bacterium]